MEEQHKERKASYKYSFRLDELSSSAATCSFFSAISSSVRPEYNVRADKWEIAQEAMSAVNREKIAKGQQPPSETKKEETPMGAPESNQAGQPS